MYQPPHFREERPKVLHALIRACPLATLITLSDAGIEANHIPMLLDAGRGGGVLQAHIARANRAAANHDPTREVLAIFQGPQRYISPSWYATKRETGKVVPTWNYVVVHAHGRLRIIDHEAFVADQIGRLTERHEKGRSAPWQVSDAPEAFIRAQMKAIVGIEIDITRLEGKWKVSQNRPEADQVGVVEGLVAEEGAGSAMAGLVAQPRGR